MTLDLSLVVFNNDMCTIGLEDGGTLILNKINESILSSDTTIDIKLINIEKISYTETDEEVHTVVQAVFRELSDKVYADLFGYYRGVCPVYCLPLTGGIRRR